MPESWTRTARAFISSSARKSLSFVKEQASKLADVDLLPWSPVILLWLLAIFLTVTEP
jgi:hypothetical protein